MALLTASFALALLATSAHAERRIEVYAAKYRVADELLPLAQTAMEGEGSASLDRGTNSLVLVGDPKAVAAALALLERQDRPPRNVVLRYDTKRVHELETRGFDVRWTAHAGDFRIGNLARPVGADSSGSSIFVRADDAMRQLTESFTGMLRVTEGQTARIETGTSVPFATLGPRGTNTEFVTAATGFEASARVLGDGSVQVDLAVFAGHFGLSSPRDVPNQVGPGIESLNAATLVSLNPGETLVVGGLDSSSESKRKSAFGGAGSESARDDRVLLLRADIE